MSYSYGHSEIVRNPIRIITENYCIVASSALLWYDIALTFTTEVHRIWHRELSYVSFAYVCMRYNMFVNRVTLMLGILLLSADDKTCGIILHSNDVGYILNLLAAAGIVIIRVYGISAKNWRWLLIVLPLNLVRPILYAIESARYKPVQAGSPSGCTYDYTLPEEELAHAVTTVAAATMVASHGILVFVTLVRTLRILKIGWRSGMRTPLAMLLFRDGILFLALLAFNAFANFYANPKDSATIFLVWPYFYEIINVIILSHFILDLRGLDAEPGDNTLPTSTNPIMFNAMPKTAPGQCTIAMPELTYLSTRSASATEVDVQVLSALTAGECGHNQVPVC